MTSLYLRLAGPAQSWAGPRATGNHVNTGLLPTRSGIVGLCAAALGARHGEWPQWLQDLTIEVRVDNPGRVEKDFQTINPRPEAQAFVDRIWTASGNPRSAPPSFTPDAQKGTSIVRRTYLAGAEFTVRLSHPDRIGEMGEAFASPGFSPYLGRKAFAPAFPFLLGLGDDGLLDSAPALGDRTALPVHTLDGRDNSYPDRIAPAGGVPDRWAWWSVSAHLPDRTAAHV
ncbi:type I-E CRISPR-associated protein Cas5/CasD [Pseudarthrobacter sp. AB1]|uniref:type I-E CRISPR-associated protein Cas5/CasD n=1 Tax=Pseudarthrobacter sp. AB1 TaxID=2138309 RepID=UPI00186B7D29|nr:type I-E CRISPR-associated protein Cas5/CasD [Pseudarthrobacter sp. AB1]MBE4719511.1 type I-E CRISPR-associated protein Cas5/CasD [Pseudarthrobacter sp. AB1]